MSRFRSIFAFTAGVIWLAAPLAISRAEAPGTWYITPEGAGRRDGSSWADAGTLVNLPVLVGRAGPGGRVLIRADLGAYRTANPIPLRVGGAPGHPVTIAGVDASGKPMKAQIVASTCTAKVP